MKRPPSEVGLICVFVLVLLLATLALSGRKGSEEPETRAHRTIRSARPGGWKGFATLLKRQELAVSPLELPPSEWPQSAAVIITGPVFVELGQTSGVWSKQQAKDALTWVEAGGTLVRFDNEWGDLDTELGFTIPSDDVSEAEASEADASSPAPAAGQKPQELTAQLAQPVAWLAGVRTIGAPDISGVETLPKDAIPLLHIPDADNRYIGSVHPRGKGRVILVHSGAFVDNEHLTGHDNARFASSLVRALARLRPGGEVLFDEYHQGFVAEGKSVWDLVGLGFRRAGVHLLFVLILGFWASGKRFGLPVPLPPRSRTTAEYATSVADLYRRARRRDAALESLFLRFRRDLCRSAHVEQDTPDAILVRHAAQALGRPDQEAVLLTLLGECRKKREQGPKQFKESELVALAQALEAARKELRIGGRH